MEVGLLQIGSSDTITMYQKALPQHDSLPPSKRLPDRRSRAHPYSADSNLSGVALNTHLIQPQQPREI